MAPLIVFTAMSLSNARVYSLVLATLINTIGLFIAICFTIEFSLGKEMFSNKEQCFYYIPTYFSVIFELAILIYHSNYFNPTDDYIN